MKSKYVNLIKDTIIFAVGSLGSKVILFLLVPLYTNCLSTSEYGKAELVFTIGQLLVPIASVTIWNSIIRFGLEKGTDPKNVLINGFCIWIAGSMLICLITPLLGFYESIKNWKWYLCVYSVIFIANQIELSYLKVIGKNKLFAATSLVQTLTLAQLNIILLLFLKTGVSGYLLSTIIANSVAVILIFIAAKIPLELKNGKVDKTLIKKMLIYSAPLILNDISWWLIHSSDKIMLEVMMSASALGIYTVASKIPGLINTFVNIFSQAWGISSIKEIESTNDTDYYSKVFNIYSMLSFGASIGFIAIIKPFMKFYVGKEFDYAWHYVPFLLLAASFMAMSSYFGAMLGALKKSNGCMWTTLIGAVGNIILNYIFIRIIGVWGAIVGTVTAYAIVTLLRMIMVKKLIDIHIQKRQIIADICIAFLEALAVSLNQYTLIFCTVALILFLINHKNDITAIITAIYLKIHKKAD